MCALQSPESPGADISEYRLEWGEDEESLELIYHGQDTCFEIQNLLPAAQYCCRLQVGDYLDTAPKGRCSLKGCRGGSQGERILCGLGEGSLGAVLTTQIWRHEFRSLQRITPRCYNTFWNPALGWIG